MTTPGKVTIAGSLVRYLRSGVRDEMAKAVDILQAELDTSLTPATFRSGLARFDDSRTLLETIGLVDEPRPVDVQLDLDRWPALVLKALASEYAREVQRVQDAAAVGIEIPAPDVPALESLLADLREKVGAPSRQRQSATPLQRRPSGTGGPGERP
jgi:hypothetical protein